MIKFYFLLFVFLVLSCGKRQCNVEEIPTSVLSKESVYGDFILKNQKGEIDTLKIDDFWDYFESEENKGLMVHQECGHFFDYIYTFKNQTIRFAVERNEEESVLKVSCEHSVGTYKVKNGEPFSKELAIDGTACETNPFSTIMVDKFRVTSIVEKNGNRWIPIGFVQK